MSALMQHASFERSVLTSLARQAAHVDALEVIDWQVQPIGEGMRNVVTDSLYRVSGHGRHAGTTIPWSLVLKVIRPSAGLPETDESHPFYWRREALAYRSRLLGALANGLSAPHCYGVVERPDGSLWIWLEDIAGTYGGHWSLERYGLAARHLGRFNGAYLAGRPLPGEPWLSRNWLRILSDGNRLDTQRAQDPRTWSHPLLRRAFPAPIIDRLLQFWSRREALLGVLDRLPRTLCHFDANYSNLFACRGDNGRDRTVVIDWAFVGHGAIGEEMSMLVWPSLLEFVVDINDAAKLEEAVLDNYIQGLADAGWNGDPALARLGYIINAAVQWGIAPPALGLALSHNQHAELQSLFGRPIAEIVERSAAVMLLLLDRLEAAQRQLDALR